MPETLTQSPSLEELRRDIQTYEREVRRGNDAIQELIAALDQACDTDAGPAVVAGWNQKIALQRKQNRETAERLGGMRAELARLEAEQPAEAAESGSTLRETPARKLRRVRMKTKGAQVHLMRWGEDVTLCRYRPSYASGGLKDADPDAEVSCKECAAIEAAGAERWDGPEFVRLPTGQKAQILRERILAELANGPRKWDAFRAKAGSVPGLVNTVIGKLLDEGLITRDELWVLSLAAPEPEAPAAGPPAWIQAGARADYHAVIGGPVTLAGAEIAGEPWQLGDGSWVAKLKGKSGGVAVEALTPAAEAGVIEAVLASEPGNVSTDPDPIPDPDPAPAEAAVIEVSAEEWAKGDKKPKRQKKAKEPAEQLRIPSPAELEEAIFGLLAGWPHRLTAGALLLNLQGKPWFYQLDVVDVVRRLDMMVAEGVLEFRDEAGKARLYCMPAKASAPAEQAPQAAPSEATPTYRADWWDEVLDSPELDEDRVARRLAEPAHARAYLAYVAEKRPDDISTALDDMIDHCPSLAGEAFSQYAHLIEDQETAQLMSERIDRLSTTSVAAEAPEAEAGPASESAEAITTVIGDDQAEDIEFEIPAGECRVCGCIDDDCSECVEATGEPCSWVDASMTLCSRCADEAEPAPAADAESAAESAAAIAEGPVDPLFKQGDWVICEDLYDARYRGLILEFDPEMKVAGGIMPLYRVRIADHCCSNYSEKDILGKTDPPEPLGERPSLLPLLDVDWQCDFCGAPMLLKEHKQVEITPDAESGLAHHPSDHEQAVYYCLEDKTHILEINYYGSISWQHAVKPEMWVNGHGGQSWSMPNMVRRQFEKHGQGDGISLEEALKAAYAIEIYSLRRGLRYHMPGDDWSREKHLAEALEGLRQVEVTAAEPAAELVFTGVRRARKNPDLSYHERIVYDVFLNGERIGGRSCQPGGPGESYRFAVIGRSVNGDRWEVHSFSNKNRWKTIPGKQFVVELVPAAAPPAPAAPTEPEPSESQSAGPAVTLGEHSAGAWRTWSLPGVSRLWAIAFHAASGRAYLVAPGHSWTGKPDRWSIYLGAGFEAPSSVTDRALAWLKTQEGKAVAATLAA